jgi:hypothetical protein
MNFDDDLLRVICQFIEQDYARFRKPNAAFDPSQPTDCVVLDLDGTKSWFTPRDAYSLAMRADDKGFKGSVYKSTDGSTVARFAHSDGRTLSVRDVDDRHALVRALVTMSWKRWI